MPTQPSPYSDSSQPVYTRKPKVNRCNQHSSPVAARPLRSHVYDLSTLKPETWTLQRPCWYCGCLFQPTNKAAWQQHFCSTPHRQAFNKYGSMPFDKIMLALREEIKKQIEAQTHEEILKKSQAIIERRVAEREKELVAKLRTVIAQMVIDPAKAVRELEAVQAGFAAPGK